MNQTEAPGFTNAEFYAMLKRQGVKTLPDGYDFRKGYWIEIEYETISFPGESFTNYAETEE